MIYITTFHITARTTIIATTPAVWALTFGVSDSIITILSVHLGNPVTYIRCTLIYKTDCNIRAFSSFKSVYLLVAMCQSLFITGQP